MGCVKEIYQLVVLIINIHQVVSNGNMQSRLIFEQIRERDLQEQARKEDLDHHLILEYMREFNQIRNHKMKIT